MITLERRPFKQIEQIAALGVTRPEAIRGNPNSFEKVPTRRPFKKLEQVYDGEREGLFAISIQQYVYVRDAYGKLKWWADVTQPGGDYQHSEGLCFGKDQDLWIGRITFYYSTPSTPGYRVGQLLHYDKRGNFIESIPAQLYDGNRKRSIVASPRGMILVSRLDETTTAGTTVDGVTFSFTGLPTGFRSCLAFDDDDNVYCTAQTAATGAAFWKWSSDGTLLNIVPSGYALGGCQVSGDGTYAWTTVAESVGPSYLNRFYKVNLSDGSLISSATATTPEPVLSMRLTPWGQLLYGMNDVDASLVEGLQLVAQGLIRNPISIEEYISGVFRFDDEIVWSGDPYPTQVWSVATSIN